MHLYVNHTHKNLGVATKDRVIVLDSTAAGIPKARV